MSSDDIMKSNKIRKLNELSDTSDLNDLSDLSDTKKEPDEPEEPEDVKLVSDVMREINSFLTDKNDTVALSQVSDDWDRALKDNTDQIWKEEWELFKKKNKNKSWFTETVYTVPFKHSNFSRMFNKFRRMSRKENKEHQSFRQRIFDQLEVVENPGPIELLITNAQRKADTMSKEEFDKVMINRPSLRMIVAKIGCLTAAPILGALGLAMVPLSIVTELGFLAYIKSTGGFSRGGGNPAGTGAGVIYLLAAAAPSTAPWYAAYWALHTVVQKRNLRKIPELYKSLREYNLKHTNDANDAKDKPITQEDLRITQ